MKPVFYFESEDYLLHKFYGISSTGEKQELLKKNKSSSYY